MTLSVATPIATPEHFPVDWDPPEMEGLFWWWDQMHHPHPVTPITFSLDGPAFSEGIGRVARAFHMPFKKYHVARFNTYLYYGNEPNPLNAEQLAELNKQMEAEMAQRAPRVLQDWENIYLPEVQALNTRLREFAYDEAADRDLADFLEEVAAIRARQWELHMLAVLPAMGSAFMFADTYESIFGAANNEHYGMLQGFPNKSVEAGQALYDLAQDIKDQPEVAAVIRETPVERVFPELDRSPTGAAVAQRLRAYLDEYGWRSDQFELIDPSWREDPAPLFVNLRAYLEDTAIDPRAEQAKAVLERERLVAEMFERAPDQAGRNQLQMWVTVAQQYLPVQENHNFYIDQMNTVLLRLPVLECGKRLVRTGAVNKVDDAFFLTLEELQEAVPGAHADGRLLVAERRAERERWWSIVPPSTLGTKPPDDGTGNPSLERFFGVGREPSRQPRVITGYGASKGVVTGTAKVVRSLAEADKLEPGDVLVCEMTMPPWTPLFSTVSAVVADSGGVLSHCAIVAREYRIPCVVGTVNGTQRIKDGQRLTVDGAQGIVRIES